MILKKSPNNGVRNRLEDLNPNYIDYYDYEEPLPQGPTRRPAQGDHRSNRVVFPGRYNGYTRLRPTRCDINVT